MRYEEFRREYTAGGLTRDMLDSCPVRQFETWLEQAVRAGIEDPTAMVLATIDAQGLPWQRIVLLKGLSPGALCFPAVPLERAGPSSHYWWQCAEDEPG